MMKFEPTAKQKELVKKYAITGAPNAQMARLIIDDRTGKTISTAVFKKAFAHELDIANNELIADAVGVVKTKLATGDGSTAKWVLETRAGWSKPVDVNHSGSLDVQVQKDADSAKHKLLKILGFGGSESVDKESDTE